MDKTTRLKLTLAADEADTWAKRYRALNSERDAIRTKAAGALKTLRAGLVPVDVPELGRFQVLPLGPELLPALSDLARFVQLAPITPADQELLHQLDTEIPRAVADASRVIAGGMAARRAPESSLEAADYLAEYVHWGLAEGIPAALDRIEPKPTPAIELPQALSPGYGLANALKGQGDLELVPAETVRARLATFTAAERHPDLAKALSPQHEFAVIISPAGQSAAAFIGSLEA